MLAWLLFVACATKPQVKPRPEPIDEGMAVLPKGLDAYIAKTSIAIATCDGSIDATEQALIFQKHGPSFDPILFHAINQQQGIQFIAATKKRLNDRETNRTSEKPSAEWIFNNVFEMFLNDVAMADGTISTVEKEEIANQTQFIYQIKNNGELRDKQETHLWFNKVSRGELPLILDTIRTIERQQKEIRGAYVAFSEQPPRESPAIPRKWTPTLQDDQEAFPWQLAPPLRGTYWVEVKENGFEAYGTIDLDGDGIFGTYMGTAGAAATPLTESDIY